MLGNVLFDVDPFAALQPRGDLIDDLGHRPFRRASAARRRAFGRQAFEHGNGFT